MSSPKAPELDLLSFEEFSQENRDKLRRKQIVLLDQIGGNMPQIITFLGTLQLNGALPEASWIVCNSHSATMISVFYSYSQKIPIYDSYLRLTEYSFPIDYSNIRIQDFYNFLVNGYLVKDDDLKDIETTRFIAYMPVYLCSGRTNLTFREHYLETGRYLILVTSDYITGDIAYLSALTCPDTYLTQAIIAAGCETFYQSPKELALPPLKRERYYTKGVDSFSFPVDIFLHNCSRYSLKNFVLPEYRNVPIPTIEDDNFVALGIDLEPNVYATGISFIYSLFYGPGSYRKGKKKRFIMETIYLYNRIGQVANTTANLYGRYLLRIPLQQKDNIGILNEPYNKKNMYPFLQASKPIIKKFLLELNRKGFS